MDNGSVRLHGASIPIGVQNDHHETGRPAVTLGEVLPLHDIAPVLLLEVEQKSVNLHGEDLRRSE